MEIMSWKDVAQVFGSNRSGSTPPRFNGGSCPIQDRMIVGVFAGRTSMGDGLSHYPLLRLVEPGDGRVLCDRACDCGSYG
jgi:hypothetical protein